MVAKVDASLNRHDEMVFGTGNLIGICDEKLSSTRESTDKRWTLLRSSPTMRISTF